MSKIQPIDEVKYAVIKNNKIITTSVQSTPHDKEQGWEEFEKEGFRCIKVRVQITPIDNHNSPNLIDKKS